jgi:hypothetical protein
MARWARMVVTLAMAVMPLGAAVAAEPQHAWKTYRNQRFGFQLQYPKDIFKPGKPPRDGAGLDFVAKDGAEILAQASFNVDTGVTPQSYRDELRGAGNVTHEEGQGNWFLLVRSEPGKVTYDEAIFT